MLIRAKKFVLAEDRLAARQMHTAMHTTHHIFAGLGARSAVLLNAAAIILEDAVNDPSGQSQKYQFDQHHLAPPDEAPQISSFGLGIGRGERIRTSGLCVPNAALYQAKLHPVVKFFQ